jgi:hypothetical protein
MTEHDIQNQIRIALSQYGVPYRTNAGDFYQGKRVGDILTDIRVVKGLPKGFSDLMFIGDDGTVAFIEVKTPGGKVRPDQIVFLEQMQRLGFRSGVARSVKDALRIIGKGE